MKSWRKAGVVSKLPRRVAGVLFTRPPVPGLVKTRLAQITGETAALVIYRAMLRHQAHLFDFLQQAQIKAIKYVYVTPPVGISWWQAKALLREVIPQSVRYRRQTTGNLGERMTSCLNRLLKRNQQVIIWGGDIPALQPGHLQAALDAYPRNCLVPAHDGGYALVSITRENFHPDIMKHISWSTRSVLRQQLENFDRLGCAYSLTQSIPDVDQMSDLLRTLLHLKREGSPHGRLFAAELSAALDNYLKHLLKN